MYKHLKICIIGDGLHSKRIQKILKSIVDKKLAIIASFLVGPISGALNGLVDKIPTPELEGSKYK